MWPCKCSTPVSLLSWLSIRSHNHTLMRANIESSLLLVSLRLLRPRSGREQAATLIANLVVACGPWSPARSKAREICENWRRPSNRIQIQLDCHSLRLDSGNCVRPQTTHTVSLHSGGRSDETQTTHINVRSLPGDGEKTDLSVVRPAFGRALIE